MNVTPPTVAFFGVGLVELKSSGIIRGYCQLLQLPGLDGHALLTWYLQKPASAIRDLKANALDGDFIHGP